MSPKYQFRPWVALLALIHASLAICAGSNAPGPHGQTPFFLRGNDLKARNFSVGFSLQSSYGAAAIIFESDDEKLNTHQRVYEAGEEYQRVMTRLSLESSQHIAPPYNNDGEYWADQPRQGARLALKLAGLPASYEVGILAQVIKELKSQLELSFGIVISEAVFSSSHLLALYQDDLKDVSSYVGIQYKVPNNHFHPYLWETAAAFAGHGLGLCEHWRDDKICQEEEDELEDESVLAVHYSRNALTVSLAEIKVARAIWEPEYRHVENFTLGSEDMHRYTNNDDYWTDIKKTLLEIMETFPLFNKPKKVLLTGDRVRGEFSKFLGASLKEYLGYVPLFLSSRAETAAARGAAEFMRRGPAPWEGAD